MKLNKITYLILIKILTLLIITMPVHAAEPQITAKPIPSGYDFPTPTTTIDKWISTNNTNAMRKHAWDIWSGMTADSGEIYQNKQLPIWETWYGSEDVFTREAPPNSTAKTVSTFLAAHRGILHVFVQPHQFEHLKSGLTMFQMFGPTDTRLLSFNKFSPNTAEFIVTPQPGPNQKTYRYTSGASLDDLNKAWPKETHVQDRVINSFPIDALEVKPVFNIISANGLTPIPIWEGIAASTRPEAPTPNTWKTCVLVDPNRKTHHIRRATPEEIAGANKIKGLACENFLYGSLSMLYSFKVTEVEAAAFNKVRGNHNVKPNDHAVLLALHVNSHETPFWTWQTFYWQPPGTETPKNFPGSKAGQPKNLKAPWTNYAVCANYNQTTADHKMDVCFNPYIETGLPSGTSSNCMSCHGVASVSSKSLNIPEEYKAPIDFFTDPLYFNSDSTRTEFSWAIADAPGSEPPDDDFLKK